MARKKWSPYENFCKLPYSIPKKCLPLLGKLEKKGPPPRGRNFNKGMLILQALVFLDVHTPYGWECQRGPEILPSGPPRSPKKGNRNHSLRLVPPLSSQEKGA